MPTYEEFLNNREQYPDDTKITLADGVDTTLGELRKERMLERDYRKKTSDVANRARALEQERIEWENARLEAENRLAEMAKQIIARNPGMTQPEAEDELNDNPLARKLSEKLKAVEEKLGEYDKKFGEAEARIRQTEEAYVRDQHLRVLQQIKERRPDQAPEDLVNWARGQYIPRLDWADKLKNYDEDFKAAAEKARREGVEEGLSKAKKELQQPRITPRRVVAPKPEDPKNFDEALNAALSDPEILSTFAE